MVFPANSLFLLNQFSGLPCNFPIQFDAFLLDVKTIKFGGDMELYIAVCTPEAVAYRLDEV